MIRYVSTAATALLLALVAVACAGRTHTSEAAPAGAVVPAWLAEDMATCRQPLPGADLAVPAGHRLFLQLDAVGVQIYTCAASPSGAAWTFTAPEATLIGHEGIFFGKHFAGPTWEALEGSAVVGAKVAGATPDPAAIPWLLLRAASHAGTGRLSRVTFIQRIATSGGLAPADGCSQASLGAVARVPYSATYCFHQGGGLSGGRGATTGRPEGS
jgi:hypothetical protein